MEAREPTVVEVTGDGSDTGIMGAAGAGGITVIAAATDVASIGATPADALDGASIAGTVEDAARLLPAADRGSFMAGAATSISIPGTVDRATAGGRASSGDRGFRRTRRLGGRDRALERCLRLANVWEDSATRSIRLTGMVLGAATRRGRG